MSKPESLFVEIERYLSASRTQVSAGEDIDLIGLDKHIESLCNTVLDLPEGEQLRYEVRLRELLEQLNSLGMELKNQSIDIPAIPVQRQAHVAYKKADSRDNFGKREQEEQ